MQKKAYFMNSMLLSLSLLFFLSACSPTPLADRNVAHQNTKDVIYTKHGKISGKAANNNYDESGTEAASSKKHPYSWTRFLGGVNHIANDPTNLSSPHPDSPSSIPEQKKESVDPQTTNWSPQANPDHTHGVTTPNANQSTTQGQHDSLVEQVIQSVNHQRKVAGLPPLKENNQLDHMAELKANDMLTKHYFSHTSPTYGSPFQMMKQLGITYTAAGENIAEGQTSVQQVMTDWMNSPGHRANILSATYTQIGVAHSDSANYWVQEFIK